MTDVDTLVAALREQMLDYTAGDTARPDLARRVNRRLARRRAGLTTAGAVLAISGVAATAVVASGRPAQEISGPAESSAAAPTSASVAVGTPQSPGPADAAVRAATWWTFAYLAQQSAHVDPRSGPSTRTERRWFGRDGRVFGAGDGSAIEPYSEGDNPDARKFAIGDRPLSFDEVLELPADTAALETQLRTASGDKPADERLVGAVIDLIRDAPLTRDVRGALGQILIASPGASVEAGVVDSRGRPATRISHTDSAQLVAEQYLDPVTWRLLESRWVAGADYPADGSEGYEASPSKVPAGQILYQGTYFGWATTGPDDTPEIAAPAVDANAPVQVFASADPAAGAVVSAPAPDPPTPTGPTPDLTASARPSAGR